MNAGWRKRVTNGSALVPSEGAPNVAAVTHVAPTESPTCVSSTYAIFPASVPRSISSSSVGCTMRWFAASWNSSGR